MDMTTFVLAKNYADKQIEKAEMGDIELDNTLTKQGFAADAKAVGDKLNSIEIPAIDSTLSVEGAAADAKAVGDAIKSIVIPEVDYPVTSVNGKTGEVQLEWSDFGNEQEVKSQIVFSKDASTPPVGTFSGIEGTSLSIGDICNITVSGDVIKYGVLEENYTITIDEYYSFILGPNLLLAIYNLADNTYKFEQLDMTAPIPGGGIVIERVGYTIVSTIDEKYIPNSIARTASLEDVNKTLTNKIEQVEQDIAGVAASAVSVHNTSTNAHQDIRLLISELSERLNTVANSTDTDLDQLAELVEYIKDNRELIDTITTAKVSVSDIIDNLETNVSNKPLSAAQGVVIKQLIDTLSSSKLDSSMLDEAIDNALAEAKASGEFDGSDGVDGTSGVYIGEEAPTDDDVNVWIDPSDDSLESLATKSYVDRAIANVAPGDSSVTINKMELIASGTNTEPVRRFKITVDNDGNPLELTRAYFVVANASAEPKESSYRNSGCHVKLGDEIIAPVYMYDDTGNREVIVYTDADAGLMLVAQGGGGIYNRGNAIMATGYTPNNVITEAIFETADATEAIAAGATYELWGVRK